MTSHKRLNMSQYQVPYCDVTQVKARCTFYGASNPAFITSVSCPNRYFESLN